jgi:hypothetical protein
MGILNTTRIDREMAGEYLHGLNPIIDFLEKIFYGSHNEVLVC